MKCIKEFLFFPDDFFLLITVGQIFIGFWIKKWGEELKPGKVNGWVSLFNSW